MIEEQELERLIVKYGRDLFKEIEHGDKGHKKWLDEKIDSFTKVFIIENINKSSYKL